MEKEQNKSKVTAGTKEELIEGISDLFSRSSAEQTEEILQAFEECCKEVNPND